MICKNMKTIVLPGYSAKNKDWAKDIQDKLPAGTIVHEWKHWSKGSFSLPQELKAIYEEIGDDKINIIAKSVGTRVAMHLVKEISGQINRLILCGIPTKGISDSAKENYSPLSSFPAERILCIQNIKDPLANHSNVEKFIHSINSKISVIEKGRLDHHYPYLDDFMEFLSE